MDSLEIKNGEEHSAEIFADQPLFLGPLCPEEIYDESRVFPRVGDEYQVEIPELAFDAERIQLWSSPADDGSTFGFEYAVRVGLAIPVMWTHNTSHHIKEELKEFSGPNFCRPEDEFKHPRSGCTQGNSYHHNKVQHMEQHTGSTGQDHCCSQNRISMVSSSMQWKSQEYIPLPGSAASSWTNAEGQSFLLGLYIFGKNLVQVMKFVEGRTMGDVLSYYYGEFFRSDAYKRWSHFRKVRSRRCILGLRIFTGPRQHELLQRLLSGVAKDVQDPLQEVFKTFNEGRSSFEEFILSLRSTVGVQVLVEAVGIGKGKHDLTGFALDPSRSNHAISIRPEIPIGKACSSLSSDDIIKFLTGDFRLSKAKSNDLFWEAVWPRLLARGWHSEQPKDLASVGSKHALVFLVPGVKKFSRKKLVKGNHYFDSVSDVLSKVASDPGLLELEVDGVNDQNSIKNENGWVLDAESDKNMLPDKKRPCYLRPKVPGCSPALMKFTVVDTSMVQGEEPFKVRSLRNLPIDADHKYVQSACPGDSGSGSSEEQSDSEDSSPSNEQVNTDRNATKKKDLNQSKEHRPLIKEGMQSDVHHNMDAVVSGTVPVNGHISKDQGFGFLTSTSSSTDTNFQFDQMAITRPQVFLAPVKRRRLGTCRSERTSRKNFSFAKSHNTLLEQGTSRGNEVCAEANSFLWNTFSGPSTQANLHENNSYAHCREFCPVPPRSATRVYRKKPQDQHFIDLNLPQIPSDYETTANFCMAAFDQKDGSDDKPAYRSETRQPNDFLQNFDNSNEALFNEQLSFNSRRQSTRSRPPTTKALEALACGFIGTKRKGRDANFPSSSRPSSRPSRRPRRSAETAASLPSAHSTGASFHFDDPSAATVHEWQMSNPHFQMLSSEPNDKSDGAGTHELFGVP